MQQAIIRDEMRTLEDICDKNIRGSSVLEYANSINPMLFQEILEAFGKECPLVYDVVESLVIRLQEVGTFLRPILTRSYVAYKHWSS